MRYDDVTDFAYQPSLIKNLLPLNGKAMLYGPSNSGKSFLALDMGMAIAQGIPWAELKTQKAFVFYVVAEGGGSFRNRIMAYRTKHPDVPADVPFVYIDDTVNLHSQDGSFDKLKRTIDAVYDGSLPLLIIFDTLAMSMAGGNENDGADMTKVLGSVSELQKRYDATVLLVHHPGKDKAKGERGHSSLRAALDTSLVVTAVNDNRNPRTLSASKQRDFDLGVPINFNLKVITIGHDDDDDPVPCCVVEIVDEIAAGFADLDDPSERLNSQSARRAYRAIRRAEPSLFSPLPEELWGKASEIPGMVVTEHDLKALLQDANLTDSDKPATVRKTISRALDALQNEGVLSSEVVEETTYYWLTSNI